MNTAYQHELDFMVAALKKMRLKVHLLHPGDSLYSLDDGLRSQLGLDMDYAIAYQMSGQWAEERTIYKIVDQFMCNHIYFRLPDANPPTAVVIGPYLTTDLSQAVLLELMEQLGISMQFFPLQSDYYASLPVLHDPFSVLAVISVLGEVLWAAMTHLTWWILTMNSVTASLLSERRMRRLSRPAFSSK